MEVSRMKRKILALTLVAMMVLSLVPGFAFAADGDEIDDGVIVPKTNLEVPVEWWRSSTNTTDAAGVPNATYSANAICLNSLTNTNRLAGMSGNRNINMVTNWTLLSAIETPLTGYALKGEGANERLADLVWDGCNPNPDDHYTNDHLHGTYTDYPTATVAEIGTHRFTGTFNLTDALEEADDTADVIFNFKIGVSPTATQSGQVALNDQMFIFVYPLEDAEDINDANFMEYYLFGAGFQRLMMYKDPLSSMNFMGDYPMVHTFRDFAYYPSFDEKAAYDLYGSDYLNWKGPDAKTGGWFGHGTAYHLVDDTNPDTLKLVDIDHLYVSDGLFFLNSEESLVKELKQYDADTLPMDWVVDVFLVNTDAVGGMSQLNVIVNYDEKTFGNGEFYVKKMVRNGDNLEVGQDFTFDAWTDKELVDGKWVGAGRYLNSSTTNESGIATWRVEKFSPALITSVYLFEREDSDYLFGDENLEGFVEVPTYYELPDTLDGADGSLFCNIANPLGSLEIIVEVTASHQLLRWHMEDKEADYYQVIKKDWMDVYKTNYYDVYKTTTQKVFTQKTYDLFAKDFYDVYARDWYYTYEPVYSELNFDSISWNNGNQVCSINKVTITDDDFGTSMVKVPSNDDMTVTGPSGTATFKIDAKNSNNGFSGGWDDINLDKLFSDTEDGTWGNLWNRGAKDAKAYYIWFKGLEPGVLTIYYVHVANNGGNEYRTILKYMYDNETKELKEVERHIVGWKQSEKIYLDDDELYQIEKCRPVDDLRFVKTITEPKVLTKTRTTGPEFIDTEDKNTVFFKKEYQPPIIRNEPVPSTRILPYVVEDGYETVWDPYSKEFDYEIFSDGLSVRSGQVVGGSVIVNDLPAGIYEVVISNEDISLTDTVTVISDDLVTVFFNVIIENPDEDIEGASITILGQMLGKVFEGESIGSKYFRWYIGDKTIVEELDEEIILKELGPKTIKGNKLADVIEDGIHREDLDFPSIEDRESQLGNP